MQISYKLFGKSNSQVAAKLTGKIAKILAINPKISLDELHEKLEFEALKNKWINQDLLTSKRYPDYKKDLYKRDNKNLTEIIHLVKSFLDIDKEDKEIEEYGLFSTHIGLSYDNCFKLLKLMEEKFNFNLEYMNISRYDFWSVYTLTDIVENNLNKLGE